MLKRFWSIFKIGRRKDAEITSIRSIRSSAMDEARTSILKLQSELEQLRQMSEDIIEKTGHSIHK